MKVDNFTDEDLSLLFTELTSSLYVLAIKLKGFHWNIIGDQFFPVHVQLDCQVTELLAFADGAAELIRQIDKSVAPISMSEMIRESVISENTQSSLIKAEKLIPVLLDDYSTLIDFCQSMIVKTDSAKRQDLSDFAITVRQYLDKYKWQFDSASI